MGKPVFIWHDNYVGGNSYDVYVCGIIAFRHNFGQIPYDVKVIERNAVRFYEKIYGSISGSNGERDRNFIIRSLKKKFGAQPV